MTRIAPHALLLPLLTATGLAALSTASAQESTDTADAGLQEVVVTATKQSQSLSKVPISVSAYTQAMLDDRGIRSINDIVAQTPGIDPVSYTHLTLPTILRV